MPLVRIAEVKVSRKHIRLMKEDRSELFTPRMNSNVRNFNIEVNIKKLSNSASGSTIKEIQIKSSNNKE